MFKYRYLFVPWLIFILSGCGGTSAMSRGQETVDISKKSIALLSIRISNTYESSAQPHLTFLRVAGPNGEEDVYRNKSYKREEDSFSEYWLGFELDPGKHKFIKFNSFVEKFASVAVSSAPLNLDVVIKPNSVQYLGHIDAVIRKKQNDGEKMAAARVYPDTLGHALAGFLTGTFDIAVTDKFDEDMSTFLSEYPGLRNIKVQKSILPQWVRPEHLGNQ